MIRAWRNELLIFAAIGSALVILGILIGETRLLLGLGLLGYLSWHLGNFLLLQFWIGRRRGFRLPVSLGVWEAVFDGLQRERLRKRRRGRRLITFLSDYRDAAESLPDALVVISQTGAVSWFNPAARKLLGLQWPADLGKDVTRVVTHPILEDDLAAGRSSRPLEIPSPANGAWMLSVQVTAAFGNQGDRLLVARDITPVFRLEQVRRDFLASVSHELRTPITVFRGYLETLQEMVEGNPQWHTPLAHLDQQAERMQALVDDLLTLSRLEMAERPQADEPVPVAEMLAEILAEARVLSNDRKHSLLLKIDPSVQLLGEEGELRSAFSNLVFNAVRHTPAGTQIEIDWQGGTDGASLTVWDQGPGIAAYHLPRLTERFYRVEAGRSRQSGGTGLGLAIVKQVLDRYSADLKIDSVVGQGTSFTCQFPGSRVHIEPEARLSEAG
ncbi:MAG: phosphate regulon sensor histidine kinase PhoR [Kiloniellales bacterium]|nr:phosphate regulon sensor histidine kinase PhoR [Kiloniellales bacterium]